MQRDSGLSLWVPQCVYTSTVTLQLVHNVHILDPLAIPINAAEARISRAGAHLALQKAVVHGILHRFVVETLVVMCEVPRVAGELKALKALKSTRCSEEANKQFNVWGFSRAEAS
jgi:hypothetical protein